MKFYVSFEQQTWHVHFAPGPPASCSVTLTYLPDLPTWSCEEKESINS